RTTRTFLRAGGSAGRVGSGDGRARRRRAPHAEGARSARRRPHRLHRGNRGDRHDRPHGRAEGGEARADARPGPARGRRGGGADRRARPRGARRRRADRARGATPGHVRRRTVRHLGHRARPRRGRARPARPRRRGHGRRMTFAPLADIRVVDLTSSLAGPTCTETLALFGADVVKVEHPERGDEARAWGPEFFDGGSVMFFAANRSKRSLALDFKDPAGKEALLRLVDVSDVFVQSLRPGTADRLGLGAADLRGRNERLVYCSIGAFGREGPLAGEPGYDPLLQAFAGIVSITGETDRPRVRVG